MPFRSLRASLENTVSIASKVSAVRGNGSETLDQPSRRPLQPQTVLTQNPPFLSGNLDERSIRFQSFSALAAIRTKGAPFSKMPRTREQCVGERIPSATLGAFDNSSRMSYMSYIAEIQL